jgi:hypothetical protein
VRLSAAGEGVFTDYRLTPQPLFSRNVIFFSKNRFSLEKHGVGSVKFHIKGMRRNFIAAPQRGLSLYIWLSTGLSPRLGRNFSSHRQIQGILEGESAVRAIHFLDSTTDFLNHRPIHPPIFPESG